MRVIGRKDEKGFTVLEIVIGLAITALLATTIAAAVPIVMKWAPRQANKLSVEEDLTFARYWLTRDANAAESYTPLSAPQYGYFQWRDFISQSMITYKVTYSYDSVSATIIREEKQNDVIQSSLPVARRILNQGDAQFSWSPGTKKLTIALTAAIVDAPGVGTHSRSATVVATLRPSPEPIVSPPSDVPIPPPPPGSVTYYLSGNPTIVNGSLVSGDVTSLHDSDGIYYAVYSSGGSPKRVTWWGQSEVMTAPTTISQIEVRFIGKADKENITVEFFVKNSDAGFPAIAESGFTFTQADTVTTRYFYLDAAPLAYINSLPERRVTLKVQASGTATFTLSTDQIIFIASP